MSRAFATVAPVEQRQTKQRAYNWRLM